MPSLEIMDSIFIGGFPSLFLRLGSIYKQKAHGYKSSKIERFLLTPEAQIVKSLSVVPR